MVTNRIIIADTRGPLAPEGILITVPKELIPDLIVLVCRGINTWEKAPQEIKGFVDKLTGMDKLAVNNTSINEYKQQRLHREETPKIVRPNSEVTHYGVSADGQHEWYAKRRIRFAKVNSYGMCYAESKQAWCKWVNGVWQLAEDVDPWYLIKFSDTPIIALEELKDLEPTQITGIPNIGGW